MLPGITPTKFGRYSCAEPMRFDVVHTDPGAPLKTVDHEPPIPVLDQEDLFNQYIDTSAIIPGAQKVNALGSCTANATAVSLGQMLTAAGRPLPAGLSAANAVMSDEWAIRFYHACTDQTGDPAQEWPPTDCGSTGLYCCHELMKQGLAGSYKTASGAQNIASLLQSGTVIQGTPYFNAWMEPGPDAFLDGDGSPEAFQAAINSGVAGGHETCITALEKLAVTETGQVIPEKCVVRVRNSWSASWGDSGSFRLHLSTLQMLGSNADFKQFVLAGPPAPAETAGLLEEAAEVIRTIAGSPEKDIDEALAWLASKGL